MVRTAMDDRQYWDVMPIGEGGRRVFVDTAWNRKPHACYDPKIDKFFEVKRLADLKDYDELYLDSLLFLGIWSELRKLIADGHKVHYFTRPWTWRKLRKRFKYDLTERFEVRDVKKTDYGDAYILWKVHEMRALKGDTHKWFRRLTMIDVELRPLLIKERVYRKWLKKTRQYEDLGIDMGGENFLKHMLDETRKTIVVKARKLWPGFMEIANRLGLSEDDLGGLTGLAGTLVFLGWPLRTPSMHKALRYFGLFRLSKEAKMRFMERTGKKFRKRYSGTAREYLNAMTAALLTKEGWEHLPPRAKDEVRVLRKLIDTLNALTQGSQDQPEPRRGRKPRDASTFQPNFPTNPGLRARIRVPSIFVRGARPLIQLGSGGSS